MSRFTKIAVLAAALAAQSVFAFDGQSITVAQLTVSGPSDREVKREADERRRSEERGAKEAEKYERDKRELADKIREDSARGTANYERDKAEREARNSRRSNDGPRNVPSQGSRQ